MYDISFYSNNSSEYELNADTLDQLYKEQLQTLRELVIKQNQTNNIELCRKWLKIFSKTTKAEKMARNCLCTLMQQQLQEYGALGEPFTNVQNCNRDLERVLRDLDDQSFVSANYSELTENMQTFTSHRRDGREMYRHASGIFTPDDVSSIECEENEKLTENLRLRRELETLRLQLTEKEIENVKLKEIAAKCQLENATYEDILENIKRIFLKAINRSLQELKSVDKEELESAGGKDQIQFKIFEKVFNDFATDTEFYECMKNFDTDFESVVRKHFERILEQQKVTIAHQVTRKYNKSKKKIREKYERHLRVQGWAQRLQLKLVKLKCFSALRRIFINMQQSSDNDANMWELLKTLEEKYQSVVSEIS